MKKINLREIAQPRVISFLGRLTIINILVSVVVSYRNFIAHLEKMDLSEFIFSNAALISTTAINFLFVFAVIYLAIRKETRVRKIFFISISVFSIVQAYFLIDSSFYMKLGMHPYTMMAYDASFLKEGFVQMGKEFLVLFILGLPVFLALEYYFARLVMPFMGTMGIMKRHLPYKWKLILVGLTCVALVAEKAIFFLAQYDNNKAIKRYALAIPLYPKGLGAIITPSGARSVETFSNLNYPLRNLSTGDRQLNLIWVTVEGIDNLEREKGNLEALDKVAESAVNFSRFYSSSSNKKENLFSIFYGLYPPYYQYFLKESRVPLLIQELLEEGYQMKAFLPSAVDHSELKKTMYFEIEQPIEAESKVQENRTVLNYFKSWMVTREKNIPFAVFLHFDACRFPFAFEVERAKHFPFTDQVNFLFPEKNEKKLYNAYLNALDFQNVLLKDLWSFIKQNAWSEQTVVVFSSIGKDEFMYGREKTHWVTSPLIVYHAGVDPQEISSPIQTVDVLPVVTGMLGIDTKEKYFTNGYSALSTSRNFFPFWDKNSVFFLEDSFEKDSKSDFDPEDRENWLKEELLKFKLAH